MSTALIVLASGTSSRYGGGNKLLAQLNGRPVAGHVIDTLSQVNFADRYAVVAHPDVANLFKSNGYACIINTRPEDGQGRSLSLGAKAVIADGHDAVCVVLADMPQIDSAHILALLDTNSCIVISEHKGVKMPPAVFRGSALKDLTHASGDAGAKEVLNMQNIKTIALSETAACDIDTRDDLDKVQ